MAGASLVNIKKVYPPSGDRKRAKKAKKGEQAEEKKVSLQVTAEGVAAVQAFNLEAADKGFMVLAGPSGCGKSTTLRMAAGLEEITSGELYIGGKLMNDAAPGTGTSSSIWTASPGPCPPASGSVRPSHIALRQEGSCISAAVDVYEMMGNEIHLHVTAGGGDVVIIVPAMDLSGNFAEAFGSGKRLAFALGGNACHVFDKDGKTWSFEKLHICCVYGAPAMENRKGRGLRDLAEAAYPVSRRAVSPRRSRRR